MYFQKKVAIRRKSFDINGDVNGDIQEGPRYSYTGRMQELVEAYNATVQLLRPRWPWYFYPGYLIYAVYWRYAKFYRGKYLLTPMPNRLYEILIKNELIKSEHVIFSGADVYDNYAESEDVNFVNLVVRGRSRQSTPAATNGERTTWTASEVVIKQILQDAPYTIVAQILPVENLHCLSNCLYVQVGNN